MQKISLLLLTKNSAGDIKKYFQWIDKTAFIDEVVCIDDFSSDDTQEVLKNIANKKIKFFTRKLDDFSTQRNFALKKCKNDWVLWLDPDEELNKVNIDMLSNLSLIQANIYQVKRTEIFLGKILKHGEVGNIYKTRLFNKHHSSFFGQVHEVIKTDCTIQKTGIEILHHGNHTVSQFFSKINFYSTLRAKELFDSKEKYSLFKLIANPLAKFIENYLWLGGFRDGIQGCIFAFGMSFHSFLVRSKLWHLQESHS